MWERLEKLLRPQMLSRLKGRQKISLQPLPSPQLNACQEFGCLAARLHAKRFLGNLDMTNYVFEPDGTVKTMVSVGRGRFLEHALSIEERAKDLATLKTQLASEPEWEAVKLGYRFGAPDEAEEVLRRMEQPVQ